MHSSCTSSGIAIHASSNSVVQFQFTLEVKQHYSIITYSKNNCSLLYNFSLLMILKQFQSVVYLHIRYSNTIILLWRSEIEIRHHHPPLNQDMCPGAPRDAAWKTERWSQRGLIAGMSAACASLIRRHAGASVA